MDKQTPTKPQRPSKKQAPLEVDCSAEETKTTPEPTPSMKRTKIGEPTIGRSPDFVKTIGLGNLTVITANGKRNYS